MPINQGQTLSGKAVFSIALVVIILFLGFKSYYIVQPGHVGVVKLLGAVQPEALKEGFHIVRPFIDVVEEVDIRLATANAKASSASKDLQIIQAQVTVQFSLTGSVAPKTFQVIGRKDVVKSSLVEPAIQESVKAITAKYTAEELVTLRAEVKVQIQEAIEKFIDITLKEKEITGAIKIANVAITDFDFSKEFNRAIEMKVRAEQEALQAKNEKLKRVTQAEAAAAEKRLAAEAAAYEIETGSKARAEAISREAAALKNNPELIELRRIEKWDGELPKISGGNALPMIDFKSVTSKK